jgi:high-affinity nickel permease
MFGLDERIADFSTGGSAAVVVLVAVLLGLRHATDPDHIAAVTTLVASGRERAARSAARLGVFWGVGHAITLVAFGLPVVLFERYLPSAVQRSAETCVAALIVLLAARLLIRWRSGYFHAHAHAHSREHHHHRHAVRSPLGAFAIGLVHGIGGSAGVAVLLLAAIPSRALAVASLVVLAFFTAASMTMLTGGLGRFLTNRRVEGAFGVLAPSLGVISFVFGVWYAAAAWNFGPSPF